MSDPEDRETAPAVWDPTARDGAGGWVRRPSADTTPLLRASPPGATEPPADPAADPTVRQPPPPPSPWAPPAGPFPPAPAAAPAAPTGGAGLPSHGGPAHPADPRLPATPAGGTAGGPGQPAAPPAQAAQTGAPNAAPQGAGPVPPLPAGGVRPPAGPQDVFPPRPAGGTGQPATPLIDGRTVPLAAAAPTAPPGSPWQPKAPAPESEAEVTRPLPPQAAAPGYVPTAMNTPQAQPLPPVQPLQQPHPGTGYQGQGGPAYGYPAPPVQPLPQQPQHPPQPQPGYGYPHTPGWAPSLAEEPSRRRPSTALLVVAVVVVAALLGVGAVYGLGLGSHKKGSDAASGVTRSGGASAGTSPSDGSQPSDSVTPSDSPSDSASAPAAGAKAQATSVDALLGRSANSRQQVINAVNAVEQCTDANTVAAAQSALNQAAADRRSLVQQAAALDVSQLPGGAQALTQLKRAWTESANADASFAKWAGAMAAGGCTAGRAPHTSDYDAGVGSSSRATQDKKTFVLRWNQIANQYGLQSRTADAL